MSTTEWSDGLLVIGAPLLLVLVVAIALLTGRTFPTTVAARNRWAVVVAAMAVPALVRGSVGVFAAFVLLNLALGRAEFAPFSRFAMFSTLGDERRIVYLRTPDGTRIRPEDFCSVKVGDMQKHFASARRGARRNKPEFDDDQLDDVGVHFVGALLHSRRQTAIKAPPPDDLEIVVARLSIVDGRVRDEHRVSARLSELG